MELILVLLSFVCATGWAFTYHSLGVVKSKLFQREKEIEGYKNRLT